MVGVLGVNVGRKLEGLAVRPPEKLPGAAVAAADVPAVAHDVDDVEGVLEHVPAVAVLDPFPGLPVLGPLPPQVPEPPPEDGHPEEEEGSTPNHGRPMNSSGTTHRGG